MARDGIDERVLVQWQLPMQLGADNILLLSIIQEQLAMLHQVCKSCRLLVHHLLLLVCHSRVDLWNYGISCEGVIIIWSGLCTLTG